MLQKTRLGAWMWPQCPFISGFKAPERGPKSGTLAHPQRHTTSTSATPPNAPNSPHNKKKSRFERSDPNWSPNSALPGPVNTEAPQGGVLHEEAKDVRQGEVHEGLVGVICAK